MPGINQELLDKILRYQIDLRRVEARTKREILEVLQTLQGQLLGELASGEIRTFSKARTQELINKLTPIIARHYIAAEEELDGQLNELAEVQVAQAERSLKTTVFVESDVILPSDTLVKRIARNVLIEGGPLVDWWKRQTQDIQFKLSGAIREGVLLNETNDQIISKVIGRGNEPGILPQARNRAAALVQTAVHQVNNDARNMVYERNDDIIKALVHLSTLDSHTSIICVGRSGLKWSNDKNHTPIGHTVPFQVPPLHFNCRSVMVPETLTFREMGLDMPEPEIGERASSLGPLDANTTMDQYLNRVSESQQDEMLGKGRADLWRRGKITLSQLLDGRGRELTLQQLRDRHL